MEPSSGSMILRRSDIPAVQSSGHLSLSDTELGARQLHIVFNGDVKEARLSRG